MKINATQAKAMRRAERDERIADIMNEIDNTIVEAAPYFSHATCTYKVPLCWSSDRIALLNEVLTELHDNGFITGYPVYDDDTCTQYIQVEW